MILNAIKNIYLKMELKYFKLKIAFKKKLFINVIKKIMALKLH